MLSAATPEIKIILLIGKLNDVLKGIGKIPYQRNTIEILMYIGHQWRSE